MKPHTKIYLNHFGHDESNFICCEICGATAVDVHHLDFKGMGGGPQGKKDVIENLMGLCRSDHDKCHADKEYNERAKDIHLEFIKLI